MNINTHLFFKQRSISIMETAVKEIKAANNNPTTSTQTISKRRRVMNASQVLTRGLWTFVVLSLGLGVSVGQTFKNNGTFVNTSTTTVTNFQNYKTQGGIVYNSSTLTVTSNYTNSDGATLNGKTYNFNQAYTTAGTIDVGGNYANATGLTYNSLAGSLIKVGGTLSNTTANNFATDTGTVEYKAAAAQTVLATIKGNKYGALTLSGGGGNTKTLGGSVTVDGTVTIAASTNFDVGASNTLTLNAATPFSAAGTLIANASNATVVYNRSSNQDVRGADYFNLTISAGGTKTVNSGASTVSIAGTLTNAAIFDLANNGLSTGGSASISNSGTIEVGGSVTFGQVHTIGGIFKYKGTSPQSIGTANYTDLDLSGAGSKTFPAGVVGVAGTYSIQGGTGSRTYTGSTFAYNGTSGQSVLGGEAYDSLRISGTPDTSSANHKNVTTANLTGGVKLAIVSNAVLNMGSFVFSGAPSTTSRVEAGGKIMWAGSNSHVIAGPGTTELYASGNLASGTYGNVWLTNGASVTIPASGSVISTGGSGTAGFFVKGSTTSLTVASTATLTVTGQDLDNEGTITNNGTITVN